MPEPDLSPIARVIAGLRLEALDEDLFVGDPGEGTGRLFGGMVAAQSTMAAQRTVAEGTLHSLHAYFLRGGEYGKPIRFVVHRLRDGRTYATRRVVAYQGGEAIFSLAASFTRPERGGEHQGPMPEVAPPEGLPLWEEVRKGWNMPPFRAAHVDAFEVRLPFAEPSEATRFVWMRPRGDVPDDPQLHIALAVYASDRTLAGAAVGQMGYERRDIQVTSLDHAMWVHRPPRFDDWILYVSESPVSFAARGLAFGAMYTRDGTRFASVAQEGLIRVARGR